MTARMATIGPRALMGDSSYLSSFAAIPVSQRFPRPRPRFGRRLGGRGARRSAFARRAGALHQLVERQVKQVPRAAVVHHDLAGRSEDRLHGLDVDALARHRRRFGVLGQYLPEAGSVALGVGDDALAVALRLLL